MAKQISYVPLEGRIAAEPEEGWIERGLRKELINIVAEVQNRRERAAALREEAERVVAEAKAEVERMILGEEER